MAAFGSNSMEEDTGATSDRVEQIFSGLLGELNTIKSNYEEFVAFLKQQNEQNEGVQEACKIYAKGAIKVVRNINKSMKAFVDVVESVRGIEKELTASEREKAEKDAAIRSLEQNRDAISGEVGTLRTEKTALVAKEGAAQQTIVERDAAIKQHEITIQSIKINTDRNLT
jgi:chromosome segregation ATPase